MASDKTKTATAAGTKNPADEVGADQVQQAFDEAAEKGYFGYVPDDTPNENYSLETPQDAPTPENTRGQKLLEEQQAREAEAKKK